MKAIKVSSSSVLQTEILAHDFLSANANLKLILLRGEVGAGKTVFVKGLARFLGIDPLKVKSPTYAYYNVYEGRKDIYHFDLYRLSDYIADLQEEIREILRSEDRMVVVEWDEKIDFSAYSRALVCFSRGDDADQRFLDFKFYD